MYELSLILLLTVFIGIPNKVSGAENAPDAVASIEIVSLSEPMRIALGKTDVQDYYSRFRAIKRLPSELSKEDIEAVFEFLHTKLEDQQLPELQFNGLKDTLTWVLLKQPSPPLKLTAELIDMYRDDSYDEMWRDYCVQFISHYHSYAPESDKALLVNALWEATSHVENRMGGSACYLLRHMIGVPGVTREKVSKRAMQLLLDPKCCIGSKIPIIVTCGELGNLRALPIARQLSQECPNIILRISAIAAVGFLGDPTDMKWLAPLAESADFRLHSAAATAIQKIQTRYPDRSISPQQKQ